MRALLLLAAVLALLAAAAPGFAYVYINSTFNGDTVADPSNNSYPAPDTG